MSPVPGSYYSDIWKLWVCLRNLLLYHFLCKASCELRLSLSNIFGEQFSIQCNVCFRVKAKNFASIPSLALTYALPLKISEAGQFLKGRSLLNKWSFSFSCRRIPFPGKLFKKKENSQQLIIILLSWKSSQEKHTHLSISTAYCSNCQIAEPCSHFQ